MISSCSWALWKMVPHKWEGEKNLWTAYGKRQKSWTFDTSTNGKYTHEIVWVPGPGTSGTATEKPESEDLSHHLWNCLLEGENFKAQCDQWGMGLGFLGGSLCLEGAALTLDLGKGEGGLCPEAETNTYLLLCLLTEMPRVEKEWPESWKQWNKVLQNVENSICQVQTGVREL